MQSNKAMRLRLALATVVLLVVLKFAVVPLWTWQHEMQQQIGIMDMKVARKKNLVNRAEEMDRLLAKAKAAYQQTLSHFYTDFADAQALQLRLQKNIEQSAQKAGITMQSINWLHVSDEDSVKVPVNIRFAATPDKMYQLIADMENSPYFVTIERLRVDGGGNRSEIQVDLDASAYGMKKALDDDAAEK